MTSIHLPDSQREEPPAWARATFDDMIRDAKKDLALQRRRVRQMRRERRREKRRAAARWARRHSRAILFWSGTTACGAGLLLLTLGAHGLALELLKVAAAAWIAAVSAQQPPQG
ncbi:hypothetical protein [Streptomyces sp. NPDC002845]